MRAIAEHQYQLSQESTHMLAASTFIQSQCSKVYFNEMQTLTARLQVGFGVTGKAIRG